MAGRLGVQSRTRDELPELRANVAALAQSGLSVVIPEGAGVEKFCALAAKSGFVVVDGGEMYSRIAGYVWQTMSPTSVNQFGVNHFSMVLEEVGIIMDEIGLRRAESPSWMGTAVIACDHALLEYIKKLINQAPGVTFVAQYVLQAIVRGVLANPGFDDTKPVVIQNIDPEAARALRMASKTVSTNGRLGIEFVLETLGAQSQSQEVHDEVKEEAKEAVKSIKRVVAAKK
jgi:hypothetical protein